MLGMMGNGNKEKGAMMGNHRAQAMAYVMSQLGGSTEPNGTIPNAVPSSSNLSDVGGAVMRALQSGDVEAFTASLQRFIMAVEEMEDDDNPFDLEVE